MSLALLLTQFLYKLLFSYAHILWNNDKLCKDELYIGYLDMSQNTGVCAVCVLPLAAFTNID